MQNFISLLVLVSLLFTNASCVSNKADSSPTTTSTSASDKAKHHTYLLVVDGMSCPTACPRKVRNAVRELPGVEDVDVSFEKQRTVISTNGEGLTESQVERALEPYNQFTITKFKEVK